MTTDTLFTIGFYIDSVPFTPEVIRGETSLGGSESACIGLARAIAALGHDVHIFATKLKEGAEGEYDGVFWHPAESEMPEVMKFASPDVFVSLRMPHVFMMRQPSKLNLLWNQDLLIDPHAVVGSLSQVDKLVYVSRFHKAQWEARESSLKSMGAWVVENGIDLSLIGKRPSGLEHRIPVGGSAAPQFIHITRPERGLDALLAMWPKIRQRWPEATLRLCRYSSMYDATGWGKICAAYDKKVEKVKAEVGGIEYLGELSKVQLYDAISNSHIMLYPNTHPTQFAETNCIAATEAQACGAIFVGSWQGALPETVHPDAGVLIPGDPTDEGVQDRFISAIARVLDPFTFRRMQNAGFKHAERCDFKLQAEQWIGLIRGEFEERSKTQRLGILRRFLNDDNHAHARVLAQSILEDHREWVIARGLEGALYSQIAEAATDNPELYEAATALDLCGRVIRQEEQTAENYATYAIQDPKAEAKSNARLKLSVEAIVASLKGVESPRILDLACGNGSMALLLAEALPNARIYGFDYSEGVLALARAAAAAEGLGGRVLFTHVRSWEDVTGPGGSSGLYDAIFCGEFLEHVEHPCRLIDRLANHCKPNGYIVMTTPSGPFSELLDHGIPRRRGHIHSFDMRDIATMFGPKDGFQWRYLEVGMTAKLNHVGYWIVGYKPGGGKAGVLDYDRRILVERPYHRVVASMIMKDAAPTILEALTSLYGVVDRVVILDTGSTDKGPELARDWGAEVYEAEWPGDFSVARNRCLDIIDQTGGAEYILWLDCDEVLNNSNRLRFFATGTGPYVAYAIRQHHLYIDRPQHYDKPLRLFKSGVITSRFTRTTDGREEEVETTGRVRFYGVVHEQPELPMNDGILPALLTEKIDILHRGYANDMVRNYKMKIRNMPLLQKELAGQGTHPPRELAYVFAIREYINIASFRMEELRGRVDSEVVRLLTIAVNIYHTKGFSNPKDKHHEVAYPLYQQAMEWLAGSGAVGHAVQVVWSFAAGQGQVKAARPEKMWVRTVEEAHAIIGHKVDGWMKQFITPTLMLEPVMVRGGEGWGAGYVNMERVTEAVL
jgi:2-polyprenyl-3-methyl-5-hydroxy-6-metoxy-1,4-benzoquinol methylase/glycosyltransferase involved in cell wall biosynthesis